MGEVLEEALPAVGIAWGEERIGSIAYVDGLILLADTPGQLLRKLDGLCRGVQRAGMSLNTKKSATFTILKDGRRKHLVLAPSLYLTNDGTSLQWASLIHKGNWVSTSHARDEQH